MLFWFSIHRNVSVISVMGSKGHHFVKIEDAHQILFQRLKIKFKLLIYHNLAQI